MKIAAIISEYNPFHNGHLHQIQEIRKQGITHIVSIMSGNFTQRGTPAIISKWVRAEMALSCGADLVIEIPTHFSASCAQNFARCGVYLADSLGCVDYLCFGSETKSLENLKIASKIDSIEKINNTICQNLKSGKTFSRIRNEAIKDFYNEDISNLFCFPNNNLAIEYLKALNFFNSSIEPINILRSGVMHDSMKSEQNFASASYIRKQIYNKDFNLNSFMPQKAYEILLRELEETGFSNIENLDKAIIYKLRSMEKEEIFQLPEISEGLENRIYKAILQSNSLEELYYNIKTKRYTLSRIRRIILSAFLGINKNMTANFPMYIKILGFNNNGKEILNLAKKSATLPIITKSSDIKRVKNKKIEKSFEFESRATDLYQISFEKTGKCCKEARSKIIIV